MSFWNKIKSAISESGKKDPKSINLKDRISQLFNEEDKSEDELIKMTCIAGLLAKVAYEDFEIHPNEKENMLAALKKWTQLEDKTIQAITDLAIDEIKTLSGIEDHLYSWELIEKTKVPERYQILESLFQVAAADGAVDNQESETIRQIALGLRLEHKHFISARASVKDHISALK